MTASRISPSFAPVSAASSGIPRKSFATFNVLISTTLLTSAIAPPAENVRSSDFRRWFGSPNRAARGRDSRFFVGIFVVFWAARDLIPGQAHKHYRFVPTDPFDPSRRHKSLLAGEPTAGLDNDVANSPILVVDNEIVHVTDLAVGGPDVITVHFIAAAQMLVV